MVVLIIAAVFVGRLVLVVVVGPVDGEALMIGVGVVASEGVGIVVAPVVDVVVVAVVEVVAGVVDVLVAISVSISVRAAKEDTQKVWDVRVLHGSREA